MSKLYEDDREESPIIERNVEGQEISEVGVKPAMKMKRRKPVENDDIAI